MTDEEALREAELQVPAVVHHHLTLRGWMPKGDAGGMWYYDRGDSRLVSDEEGDDGSGLPMSLADPFAIYRMPADGDEPVKLRSGRLIDICN